MERGRAAGRAGVLAAIACASCMSLGLAPLFVGTFAIFLEPVSNEFGWPLSVFPQMILVASIAGALSAPIAGRIIDKFNVRFIMIAGLCVWSLCLFGLANMQGDRLTLYTLPLAIGITGSFAGPILFTKVISGWFDARRALVMGLVISAVPAIATAAAVAIGQIVIQTYGWRTAYGLFAAAVPVIGIPVTYFFMHEARAAPSESGETPPALEGMTAKDALRELDFWRLVVPTALVGGGCIGIIGHFGTWSSERGLPIALTTLAISVFSLSGPVGPIVAGWMVDRYQSPKALIGVYALPILGLLLVASGYPFGVVLGAVLLGLGFSAVSGMLPFLSTRYFGLRHGSEIFGLCMGGVALGMGSGPVLIGVSREASGDYRQMMAYVFAAFVAALLIAASSKPFRFGMRPQSQ